MKIDPLITGLLGVVIGAAATLVSSYLKGRVDKRRDLIKLAVDIAQKDFDTDLNKSEDQRSYLPMSSYVYFHLRFLEELERGKLIPRGRIAEASKRN